MTALNALLDPFLTLLYPPRCLICHALGEAALCAACEDQILPVPEPACPVCGHTVDLRSACVNCLACRPDFVRARALGAYEGVLQTAIHHFKYHDRPQLAGPLGSSLAQYARAQATHLNNLQFDALIPMPMHPVRKRLRGYNQSERLAQVMGRELVLPVAAHALVRTRATRAQVGLARDARRSNLRGAFAVRSPDAVAGKTLLLIDDVSTTSSSLNLCAEALKAAGAKAVYALTLAAG